MRLIRIILHNFTSHKDTTIDLSKVRLAAITGPNGAGKSSILEAITWVLFGETSKFEVDDDIIEENSDNVVATLVFEIDNVTFTATRSKKRGKSAKLKLLKGEEDIGGTGSIAEIERKITEILNAKYETFIYSVLISQGNFDQFLKLGSADTNSVFMSFLDIEKYGKYAITAGKKRDLAEADALLLNKEIDNLKSYISIEDPLPKIVITEQTITKNNDILSGYDLSETKTIEDISKLTTMQNTFTQSQALRSSMERELVVLNTECDKKISQLKTCKLESGATIYNKYINLNEDDLSRSISKKMVDNGMLGVALIEQISQLQDKKNKIQKINGECYVCGNKLTKEQIEHTCKEIDVEIAEKQERQKQNKIVKSAIDAQLQTEIAEMSDFKLLVSIKDINTKLELKEKQIQELPILTSNKEITDNLATLNSYLYKIRSSKESVKTQNINLNISLGSLQEQLKNKVKAEKEITELSIKLKKIEEDVVTYTDLIKAFSRKGIPALIINNSLPLIETEANRLLSKFGGGLKVEFVRREDKNDTLDIVISKMGRSRKVSTFSGGEVVRIALAIRISLSKLLMLRNSSKISLLVIDEPSFLDESKITQLIEVLKYLSTEYEQILVISHLDALITAFPTTIYVSNTEAGKGSQIVIK